MAKQQRRPKGEGSIVELPNGKFKVVFTLPKGINKTQRRKCATVDTRKKAREKLAEFTLKYGNKNEVKKINAENITFKEYVERWLKQYKASVLPTTYKSNESLIYSRMIPAFGDIRLANINTDDVNEFLTGLLEDGLKVSSVRKIKTLLGTISNSAENIITKNPTKNSIRLPKASKKSDLPLPTEVQIKEALKTAKKIQGTKGFYKYLYPIFILFISTGMRRGEVAGLKWERINFKDNIIEVREQITRSGHDMSLKTDGSIRNISVAPEIMQVINKLPRICEYVFSSNNKTHLNNDYITIFMKRFFKYMKFPEKCTVHDLRHYHATTLLKNKMYINAVSKRLGHSDVKITLSIYGHYLPSMDEEAVQIIGNDYVV